MPNLLPCPFCGESKDVELEEVTGHLVFVACHACEIEGQIGKGETTSDQRADAIAKWNTRGGKAAKE